MKLATCMREVKHYLLLLSYTPYSVSILVNSHVQRKQRGTAQTSRLHVHWRREALLWGFLENNSQLGHMSPGFVQRHETSRGVHLSPSIVAASRPIVCYVNNPVLVNTVVYCCPL